MLWAPFLLIAHGGVLVARAMGSQVSADGFSPLYRMLMAFRTALYGFLLAVYIFIACYPDWAGISSYENRFFMSLTALFVMSLAFCSIALRSCSGQARAAGTGAITVLGCLILWNLAFMFQWGTYLVPARGSILWAQMIHDQFFVLPSQIVTTTENVSPCHDDASNQEARYRTNEGFAA